MKLQIFLCLLSLFYTNIVYSGPTSQKIQELHRQIGEGLIRIRKESPSYQDGIYTLLDQVGKLCRLSNLTIQKKKKMKKSSIEEREMRFTLSVENEKLKSNLNALNQEMRSEQTRYAENERRVNTLMKEKTLLAQKNREIKAKELEYKNKVKALESSLTKTASADLPAELPERLSKNEKPPHIFDKSKLNT